MATVSIVIPSHNNASLLARTLAGFVAQEVHTLELEVIVVDNNSEDESIASVQRQFRSKLPMVLIQQPQLPHPFALCRARNTGMKLAKGEWIISIDADTIPNRSYLKTLEACINAWGDRPVIATGERIFVATDDVTPADIIGDPSLLERLPLAPSPSNYGLSKDRRFPLMELLPNIDHPWDYMHGCNVVYRRADAMAIEGYQEAYDGRWGFEDIDFAYRMITEAGCSPLYVPGLCMYHQDLPEDQPKTERYDKSANPNWARICKVIPGYRGYKMAKYRQFSSRIKV